MDVRLRPADFCVLPVVVSHLLWRYTEQLVPEERVKSKKYLFYNLL